MDRMEIRLNEMAVAIGAPMNPSRIGSGPHTGASGRSMSKREREGIVEETFARRTKEVVQYRVHRRDPKDDSRGHGEQPCVQ